MSLQCLRNLGRLVRWQSDTERPLTSVPRAIPIALLATLAAQMAVQAWRLDPGAAVADLPPAPSYTVLHLASLGDPLPLAKTLALYVQSYDQRAGNPISFRQFDYRNLAGWLGRILQLDPRGQYPLMLASRLYAEVPNEPKQRQVLDFVYREFLKDPERRWPWLAHAAVLAKHRLHDLPLARRYAAALQQHATGPDVPPWARQMEAFILEDMNELEAARLMIAGFIDKGRVTDTGELRFLEQRLKELEERTRIQR